MAKGRAQLARFAQGALLAAALAACSPIHRSHGYAPTEAELEEIVVGVDTRDSVAEVIGTPQTSGVISDAAWYYVASDWKTVGLREPQVTGREVVAISFDEAGTVRNIERFGLEDGRVIAINRRVTDDNIQGISLLRQLLGNIGQFRAEDFVD